MSYLLRYVAISTLCYVSLSDVNAACWLRSAWGTVRHTAQWTAMRHASTAATAAPSFSEYLKVFSETPWQEWASKGLDSIAFAKEIQERSTDNTIEVPRPLLLSVMREYCGKIGGNCATELPKFFSQKAIEYTVVVLLTIEPSLETGAPLPYNSRLSERLTLLRGDLFIPIYYKMSQKGENELTEPEKNLMALDTLLRVVSQHNS